MAEISWDLFQHSQRILKRAFPVDPLPEILNKYFAYNLIIGIYDEHTRVRDTIGWFARFVLLIQNAKCVHRAGIDI
jgi:hypothetical protein